MEKKDIFLNYFLCIMVVLIILMSFISAVSTMMFDNCEVQGNSMEPTLHNGDTIKIRKSTASTEYDTGDIIVIEKSNNREYIKRVIGTPGDTVEIKDGTVYINDEQLTEEYLGENTVTEEKDRSTAVNLGDDEYFVLGDNRENSTDSRDTSFGTVLRSDILGKVVERYHFTLLHTNK